MWKTKSCPRCGGDIFLDIDEDTWFDHCLQCGYERRHASSGCPSCGGEIYLDTAEGAWFSRCRRCGYIGEMHDIARK